MGEGGAGERTRRMYLCPCVVIQNMCPIIQLTLAVMTCDIKTWRVN